MEAQQCLVVSGLASFLRSLGEGGSLVLPCQGSSQLCVLQAKGAIQGQVTALSETVLFWTVMFPSPEEPRASCDGLM